MEARMADTEQHPLPRWIAAVLIVAAAATAAAAFVAPLDARTEALVREGAVAGAALLSSVVIWWSARRPGGWPSGGWLATLLFLIAVSAGAVLVQDLRGDVVRGSRLLDAAYLLYVVPVLAATRKELRAHFSPSDRKEIVADAGLVIASLGAICYVLIHPEDAGRAGSLSAGTFSVIAATAFTTFGVIALWVPSPPHIVQAVAFTAMSAATVAFGWEWTHGAFDGSSPEIQLPYILGSFALATAVVLLPRRTSGGPTMRMRRFARPALTSVSVAAACGALATVAILGDDQGIAATQSTALIALLGVGVAARILANQIGTTQANQRTREALADKEAALLETDLVLEREREATETLRQSEEHLRLVFEAAVDGIVELDERDVILRANDAFCGMVRLDRATVEGQPWTAIAAAIGGADQSFALLPSTGQGMIERPEGQPLYLESRISDVPMSPPRRLLLVRDVTAGRVADQTIRSLFQFLQDRDEDRSRLLRRTNAAIEAERNRVARDLHDGPVQGVSAASLSLEAALLMIKAGETDRGIEVLTKIRRELAQEADALRRLMSGLRPPLLEERGLIPALREILADFGNESSVSTGFSGRLESGLAEDLETLAYRVVQEALSNAAKHAGASHMSVSVESDQGQLRIEVVDDGRGFDSNRAREFLRMGRVGLASMRERVELASGTLVVRSTPGQGTTIVATLPIETLPVPRELAQRDAG
jgi:signal transduction histidine kinase